MRRLRLLALLAGALVPLVIAATSCSGKHRFEIQSNTCWIMSVDKQNLSVATDCGNANFSVSGVIYCVRVLMLSDTGYVRVRIDGGPWAEAVGPPGIAETCRQ